MPLNDLCRRWLLPPDQNGRRPDESDLEQGFCNTASHRRAADRPYMFLCIEEGTMENPCLSLQSSACARDVQLPKTDEEHRRIIARIRNLGSKWWIIVETGFDDHLLERFRTTQVSLILISPSKVDQLGYRMSDNPWISLRSIFWQISNEAVVKIIEPNELRSLSTSREKLHNALTQEVRHFDQVTKNQSLTKQRFTDHQSASATSTAVANPGNVPDPAASGTQQAETASRTETGGAQAPTGLAVGNSRKVDTTIAAETTGVKRERDDGQAQIDEEEKESELHDRKRRRMDTCYRSSLGDRFRVGF